MLDDLLGIGFKHLSKIIRRVLVFNVRLMIFRMDIQLLVRCLTRNV